MATAEQQARTKKWREDNRDHDRLRKQKQYQDKKDQVREKQALRYKTKEATVLRMLKSASDRAAEKGWEFSLTVDDVVIPELCPYLGSPLDYSGGKDTVPSLDRINSSKHYVAGNVRVISYLANTMKNNATEEQLRAFSVAIQRLH